MLNGYDVLQERCEKRGIECPKDDIDEDVFVRAGLPMIVSCKGCTMTMGLFSAAVDDEGFTWCADCIGESDEK